MIAAAIARLRDQLLAGQANPDAPFRLVDGAMELEALTDRPPAQSPALYVLPLSEQAGDNNRATAVSQRVAIVFGTVIVLRRHGDAAGAAKLDEIQPLRLALRDALLGWAPDQHHDVVTFHSGRLADMGNGAVWWLDAWQTSTHYRKT